MIREGARYFTAAVLALGVDVGIYSGLIYLASVHYLVAGAAGFTAGLVTIYLLSIRWVFKQRRLADARVEFALFALIGVAGLALNHAAIYAGVELASLDYVPAKLVSAGVVFCFNFGLRKLLLFSRPA